MRELAVAVALAACAGVGAAAEQPASPGQVRLEAPAPGRYGYVVRADGAAFLGKIVRVEKDTVAARLPSGAVAFVPAGEVVGVLDATVPPGSLGAGARPSFVVLRGGQVYRGIVVERSGDAVVLDVPPAGRRVFDGAEVARVIPAVERTRVTEGRDRHLTAPSAVLLPARGVRVALIEGTDLSVTAGLNEHLALSIGSTLPALHAAEFGANLNASARAGVALGERLNVAAGLHARAGTAGTVEVFLSGTATLDLAPVQLTLHGGPMFEGASGLAPAGATGLALAATFRVSPMVDVLGEAWATRPDGGQRGFGIAAVRWRAWRMVIDLGVVRPSDRGTQLWFGLQLDAGR